MTLRRLSGGNFTGPILSDGFMIMAFSGIRQAGRLGWMRSRRTSLTRPTEG